MKFIYSLLLSVATLMTATTVHAENIGVCAELETDQNFITGTAAFVGESWNYEWTVTQEWRHSTNAWVTLNPPIVETTTVRGEGVIVTFTDGTSFTLDDTRTTGRTAEAADRLLTIDQLMDIGPIYAVKRTNGEVALIQPRGIMCATFEIGLVFSTLVSVTHD